MSAMSSNWDRRSVLLAAAGLAALGPLAACGSNNGRSGREFGQVHQAVLPRVRRWCRGCPQAVREGLRQGRGEHAVDRQRGLREQALLRTAHRQRPRRVRVPPADPAHQERSGGGPERHHRSGQVRLQPGRHRLAHGGREDIRRPDDRRPAVLLLPQVRAGEGEDPAADHPRRVDRGRGEAHHRQGQGPVHRQRPARRHQPADLVVRRRHPRREEPDRIPHGGRQGGHQEDAPAVHQRPPSPRRPDRLLGTPPQ